IRDKLVTGVQTCALPISYWSISPVAPLQRKTTGNIPIGFADDAAYIGGWQQRLAQTVMAVPGTIRLISGMDAFRYVTLLFLLRKIGRAACRKEGRVWGGE